MYVFVLNIRGNKRRKARIPTHADIIQFVDSTDGVPRTMGACSDLPMVEIENSKTQHLLSIVNHDYRPPIMVSHLSQCVNIKHHAEQLAWATPEAKYELIKQYIGRIDIIGKSILLKLSLYDYRDTSGKKPYLPVMDSETVHVTVSFHPSSV